MALSKKLFSLPAAVPCGCRLQCQRWHFSGGVWSASHPGLPGISELYLQPVSLSVRELWRGCAFQVLGNVSHCIACLFCRLRAWSRNELVIYSCSASFCAEHARRNTLALQAQMKKSNPGPVSETLLCQLSSYAKTELGSQTAESSRSEASRILGKN